MAKVLCVLGPTASGKTALSVELAKYFGGQVVSADSMQIYKNLDIGTAKATLPERCGITHHMLDIIPPTENYSVADYATDASRCIDDLLANGILPVIAGGTGLYIDTLISGIPFGESKSCPATRERLTKLSEEEGGMEQIFQRLCQVDPESANVMHINNKKRVIRALEFFEITGKTISQHNRETQTLPKRYEAVYIGLTTSDRSILYDRINQRVDKMIADGLVDEVKHLYENNMLGDTSLQAIGYKEIVNLLKGECNFSDAVDIIKQRSRNYAKRQITWFKRNKDIFWINYDNKDDFAKIRQISIEFAQQKGVK